MTEQIYGRFVIHRGGFSLDAEIHLPGTGVTGVFGPSGCGKTTFLRCLAGLERADDGVLTIDGETWQDESKGVFVPPYNRQIGVVFQDARLFPHLNVQQNIEFGQKRKPAVHDHASLTFDYVIDLLNIRHLLQRMPAGLSGGEGQRIAIARALLAQPKLLLMDEPLAALDQSIKQDVMPFFDRIHEEIKIPIVYVSHSIEEILHLSDTVVTMETGKIKLVCPLEQALLERRIPVIQGRYDNILCARLREYDEVTGYMTLESPLGELSLFSENRPVSSSIKFSVDSEDVVLSKTAFPENTGILSSQATVTSIDERNKVCQLEIQCGELLLKLSVPVNQVASLALDTGADIYINLARLRRIA